MSNFYGYRGQNHMSHMNSHPHQHHGGRSRRAHRQVKAVRTKEVVETVNITNFRREFEAARAFEIEDDEIFCPFNLLTEDDLQSIGSTGSDRSSLSSGSPDQSPLQHQLQPTPSFVLSSATNFTPSYQQSTATTKIHQPLAQRQLKAIPIVDPSTRTVASPPPSVSPARQMQQQLMNRRGW